MKMYYKNQAIDVKHTDAQQCTITVPFKNGFRSFETTPALVAFLQDLPFSIARDALLKKIGIYFQVDEQNAVTILEQHLLTSYLVLESEQDTLNKKKSNGVLLFRKQLLNANMVNHLSWLLKSLCNRSFVITFGFLSLIFQIWLLANLSMDEIFSNNADARPLSAFLLIVGGLVFHELGHAASAFKFGCRKVTIGFGWYVIYFVMLADLSESWTLERRQRLLISLAGGYFQSLYILALGTMWLIFEAQSCLIAASVLTIYNILNLNPFFRLDGYWLMSDWLNIKNLREKAAQLSKDLFSSPRRLHLIVAKTPKALTFYTLGLVVFLPVFYGYVFFVLAPYAVAILEFELSSLYYNFANYPLGYNLITVFFSTMILVFCAILPLRFARIFWQMAMLFSQFIRANKVAATQ